MNLNLSRCIFVTLASSCFNVKTSLKWLFPKVKNNWPLSLGRKALYLRELLIFFKREWSGKQAMFRQCFWQSNPWGKMRNASFPPVLGVRRMFSCYGRRWCVIYWQVFVWMCNALGAYAAKSRTKNTSVHHRANITMKKCSRCRFRMCIASVFNSRHVALCHNG